MPAKRKTGATIRILLMRGSQRNPVKFDQLFRQLSLAPCTHERYTAQHDAE